MNKNTVDILTLKNYDKNPRSIKKDDFERLKKHITDHGQMQPLVVTKEGEVLGGNMRLRAYKELGIKDVWVEEVTPQDDADKLRIALVLNDRAGFYDADLLANLIPEYPDFNWEDYTVDLKEPQSLQDLIDSFTEVEEDEVPEVSNEPAKSELGKVYQLGRHRLMCGDATKIEDVELLMDGQKADMVFTDPPYGMNYDVNMSDNLKKAKLNWTAKTNNYSPVIGDDKPFDYQQFSWLDCQEQFWWGGDYFAKTLSDDGSWFVWDKRVGIEDVQWSTSEFELCWSKQKHHRQIVRIRWSGLLGTEKEFDGKTGRVHPTQKPVELSAWFINKFSKPEQKIIDLFGGSGSTLIACEQTNRTCYMMELEEKYVDVVRRRWVKFTTGSENGWVEKTPVL